MKKLAIIFHDSNYLSGATHSMIDICDKWIEQGHDNFVAVFPTEGSAVEYLRKQGIKVKCTYYWEMRRHSDESIFYSLSRWPLREKLMIESYYNVAKNLVPFLREEGVEILYCNTSTSCVGVWLKKMLKLPLIYHVREFGIEDQCFQHFHGEKWFNNKLKNADEIIVISKALLSKYKNSFDRNRISVVYNDVSKAYINPCNHKWDEPIKIMSCGAIIPGKGHMDVIRATCELTAEGYPVQLFVVGNDKTQYAPEIKNKTAEIGGNRSVEFTGLISDMNEFRKKIDIGVVASVSEAFGRITIEGMLSQLLIIGANAGANPELIEDGVTGLLYESGNVDSLKQKIIWAIKNKERAKTIGENSMKYAKKYCQGYCADEVYNIICRVGGKS